jgi:TrmH family RNA methyltransferase
LVITSRHNPIVQRVRAVARGASSAPPELCFVEGIRLAEEWLRSGLQADAVLVSERLGSTPRGAELRAKLDAAGVRCEPIADSVLDSISNVRQDQGIAVAVRRPTWKLDDLLRAAAPLVVVAAGLQDPGNLGTIIRTAHAAGADGVVTVAGTVSPFNAKCIRASAGSVLRLPVVDGVELAEFARLAEQKGVMLVACSASAQTSYLDADLTGGVGLVLGQEGSGLPPETERACGLLIRIPTAAGVESLNVAVSAAVVLYEAARQRAGTGNDERRVMK